MAIGANCTFRRAALESIGGHGVGLAYLRTRLAREPGHHFDLHQNGPRVLARLEIAQ